MLTGKVPFTGDAPVEIAMKHLSAMPEPPSKLRPEVPHDLDAVVMRALAKDPDERYDSAEEMDADLARVARGLAVSRQTEEAMTQVLAGAEDADLGDDGRAARATPPPAPPAYRPPARTTRSAPRRSPWPWISGCSRSRSSAARGYLLYDRIQDQLDKNRPVDGQRRRPAEARRSPSSSSRPRASRYASIKVASRHRRRAAPSISQDPAGGEPRAEGLHGHALRLDRHSRSRRCPT